MVPDGGEHGPDAHGGGVLAGIGGALAHEADAFRQRLIGEEGVEDNAIEDPPRKLESFRAQGAKHEGNVFLEGRILGQPGILTCRAVVPQYRLPLPQAAHDAAEVFHALHGDARQPHGIKQPIEAPPQTQGEAAAG